MDETNKEALIIFAREPKLGQVKTRLARDLPPGEVLTFYENLLQNTLITALKVPCDERVICYTGGRDLPFLDGFKKNFSFARQRGTDLGARMRNAFLSFKRKGFQRIVIIGSDCPTLRVEDIARSFQALDTHDAVLGPARDGGYYLIGLREVYPSLFERVPWSTADVFSTTVQRLRGMNKRVYFLETKEDIDTIDSFRRLTKQAHR